MSTHGQWQGDLSPFESGNSATSIMSGGPILPVPYDPYANGDMIKWYNLKNQLRQIKDEEMALRKKIAAHMFPDAEDEATHYKDLPDGARLKLSTGLDRKIDEATYKTSTSEFVEHQIPIDLLVLWEPVLNMREYRKLDEDKRNIFDQCLTIKPSSPSMEIVKAKQKKELP